MPYYIFIIPATLYILALRTPIPSNPLVYGFSHSPYSPYLTYLTYSPARALRITHCIAHYALCIAHCIVHSAFLIAHYALCIAHSSLRITHCALRIPHCALRIVHCALYCALRIVHCTLYCALKRHNFQTLQKSILNGLYLCLNTQVLSVISIAINY